MRFKAYCTYHNVGQGLFFSGKLKLNNKEFNFVYDCGSETLSERQLENRIDGFIETLPQRDNKKFLDLLVISHFHNDHINGLDYLLNKVKVDTVIIPYISPVEILLYAIVNSKPPFPPDSYYQFLANPFTYLLEKGVSKIIVIGRGDEEGYEGDDFIPPDAPIEPNEESSFDYGKQGYRKQKDNKENEQVRDKLVEEYQIEDYINDGKVIPRSHYGYSIALGICLFRFFYARKSISNFDRKLGRFKDCLNNERGIRDINNSILTRKDILNEIKRKRNNKFRKCYGISFGKSKLNLTSLVLFNLALISRRNKCRYNMRIRLSPFFFLYLPYRNIWWSRRLLYDSNCGQFLTGDAELKDKKVFEEFKKHYSKVLDRSFIFQLPHHGSKDNWNKDILEELVNNEIFVAPAGINNKYNHPSWNVIWEIIASGKFPIFVNELNWFEFFIEAYY